MSLSPGTQLGPYRIEDTAGAGGMGEVYRAKDTRLDRTVAIKVLPTHLSGRPDLRQRFDREAKTISSLQHPNICALFDVGHENEIDFLVMEYLEGKTLAERLKEGPVSTEELLTLGVQITEALEAAHKKGVTHRDLKPANIMLTRTGVKLLDFGLAKAAEAAAEPESASSIASLVTQGPGEEPLTAEGTILGTFQYMSPEQLEGQEADARTDIFSLGAVLYEMATGRKAFAGKSQASLIASIMSSQPEPISAIQPMTPPALDRVIRTCLEKDPEDRWQTAHDVALQLKWIGEGGSEIAAPRRVTARRKSRERMAWAVAGIAAAAAVGLAGLLLTQPKSERPQMTRFQIEAPGGVVSFGSPRISPDGRFITFNGTDSLGVTMVWLRPLGSLDAYSLPGTEGCQRPFWSPDSRHVGFFSGSKLKRVPITGGPPLTLCEFSRGADGVWGAENMILFDGRGGDSIQVVSAGGGVPGPATVIDRAREETGHGWPFFLPDGKRFLYINFRTGEPSEIRLGELGSFDTVRLTEGDSRIEYIAPGYLVFERNGTLLGQPFDADAGKLTGDPFPLTEGIGTGNVGLAHFSGSDNGTLIYTSGDTPERQLIWVDRKGRVLERVLDPMLVIDPALSPDGRRVAVEIRDDASENSDIWIIDLERRIQSRLTFDPEDDYCPIWSPDGSQMAFTSNRGGGTGWAFRKRADGTGEAERVHEVEELTILYDWLSPSETLFGTIVREGQSWDVVSFALDGEGPVRDHVTSTFGDGWARISPDGRYIVYASTETGRWEIYLTTFEGAGKWQVSRDGGIMPFWREDGRELYFLGLDQRLMAVDVSLDGRVAIGIPQDLFHAPVSRNRGARNHYVPTPDGERFLLVSLLDHDRVPPTTVILNWAADLTER